jgi:hypothetical protein
VEEEPGEKDKELNDKKNLPDADGTPGTPWDVLSE